MPPDASLTKRRILDAAHTEFTQFGLAGARVDRIAELAQANKRSIYMHYGNKEQLFEVVVTQALTEMSEAVPFDAEDLPHYAGQLFDYLLLHQETMRLATWARLERPYVASGELAAYRPKIAALQKHFSGRAVDVLVLALGLITAWSTASPSLLELATESAEAPQGLARHRAMMITCVAAVSDSASEDK